MHSDGLPVRFDDGDQPLLVARVGHVDVLRGDPVDDLPAGIAADSLDDAAADHDRFERVVGRRDGQGQARVAAGRVSADGDEHTVQAVLPHRACRGETGGA